MAIKYLAGERLVGTTAERVALTTTPTYSQDYSSLASTYSPDFTLLFDEGTGTPVNEGTNKNVTLAVSNANPAWTANGGGYLGTSGSYGMVFDSSLSTGNFTEAAPCIHWDDLDGGTAEAWSVMLLIKFIDNISDNDLIGSRDGGGIVNNAMSVGGFLNTGYTPCGNRRFGSRAYHSTGNYSTGGWGWEGTNSNTNLTPDVWHTLAITNTTGRVHIMYLDGVADGGGSYGSGEGGDNPISGHAIFNPSDCSSSQVDKHIIDTIVYKSSTVTASEIAGWDSKIRGESGSFVYPNLSNGTIFEESDTGTHFMWNGSNAWNEIT